MDERNELIEAVKELKGELELVNERLNNLWIIGMFTFALFSYAVYLIRT